MCETVATLVAYGASTCVVNGKDGSTGFGGLWGRGGVEGVVEEFVLGKVVQCR